MVAGPLAIIAGSGNLPLEIGSAALEAGHSIYMVGLVGNADPSIEKFPHIWVKFGELGKLFRQLAIWECRDLIIVGGVNRPHFSEIGFDLGAVKSVPNLTRLLKGGDDNVLNGIVAFFESHGYTIVSPVDIAAQLSASIGHVGSIKESEGKSIDYGFSLLGAMAPFDVGQAAVVIDERAVAVEGIEGTDLMLERIADLRSIGRLRTRGRAGVLVKAPKRGQNMKIDLPTIGPRTIALAIEAGLSGIAIAAGGVLIVERKQVIEKANEANLFIVGKQWTVMTASAGGM